MEDLTKIYVLMLHTRNDSYPCYATTDHAYIKEHFMILALDRLDPIFSEEERQAVIADPDYFGELCPEISIEVVPLTLHTPAAKKDPVQEKLKALSHAIMHPEIVAERLVQGVLNADLEQEMINVLVDKSTLESHLTDLDSLIDYQSIDASELTAEEIKSCEEHYKMTFSEEDLKNEHIRQLVKYHSHPNN